MVRWREVEKVARSANFSHQQERRSEQGNFRSFSNLKEFAGFPQQEMLKNPMIRFEKVRFLPI
jgi:hypothetical protein